MRIGDLRFQQDIPLKYMEKSKLKRYLKEVTEAEFPVEMDEKNAFYLQYMGFSQDKIDIRGVRAKIVANSAGAFYNRSKGEIVVLEEYRKLDMIKTITLAHELRFALQDQYYDLDPLLKEYSAFDDRGLARLAALKGDSTFVMVLFNGFSPEVMSSTFSADSLLSMSPLGSTAQLHQAPEIIRQQIIMPYIHGLKFSTAVFTKKKWKGVNKVLLEPPLSSEQILHPEKYFKKEKPTEVNIVFKPENYSLYHSGVIGEFYIIVLLGSHTNYISPELGWGGDFFKIYRNDHNTMLLWKSAWDDEKSCATFYLDFKHWLEKKYDITFKEGVAQDSPDTPVAGENQKSRESISFIAGNSGKFYHFMRRAEKEILYVKTDDRDLMNKFIYGGTYD